ncbi:MAG: hypothetical protein WCC08_00765, partial [Terrimicrobiaceae bacterium]
RHTADMNFGDASHAGSGSEASNSRVSDQLGRISDQTIRAREWKAGDQPSCLTLGPDASWGSGYNCRLRASLACADSAIGMVWKPGHEQTI